MKAKSFPTKNSIFWALFLTLVLLLACQTGDTAVLAKTSGFSPRPSASRPILHTPPLLPIHPPLPGPEAPLYRGTPLPGPDATLYLDTPLPGPDAPLYLDTPLPGPEAHLPGPEAPLYLDNPLPGPDTPLYLDTPPPGPDAPWDLDTALHGPDAPLDRYTSPPLGLTPTGARNPLTQDKATLPCRPPRAQWPPGSRSPTTALIPSTETEDRLARE